jgi:hypothetical protein
MGAVDERFAEVQPSSGDEVVGQRLQRVLQYAVLAPALKATEARCVGWVAVGHVGPRGARAKHPQDAVEHIAWVTPRTTATVLANLRLGKKRFDCSPLFVGEIHHDLRSQS